jgi:hypothetical protein
MASIGNIPSVLSVDVVEEDTIPTELSEDEKSRQKWMVLIVIFFLLLSLLP